MFTFPIGYSQQISSPGGIILSLGSRAFSPDFNVIGYKRNIRKDYLKSVTHQLIGTPTIIGVRHPRYFEFEWELLLTAEEYQLLYAMWIEQTDAINSYSSDIRVKLFDARQVLLVRSPRQRAKILNTALPLDTPEPPANFEYIWPIFNIFITELEETAFILSKSLYKVRLKANELTILSTDEDE